MSLIAMRLNRTRRISATKTLTSELAIRLFSHSQTSPAKRRLRTGRPGCLSRRHKTGSRPNRNQSCPGYCPRVLGRRACFWAVLRWARAEFSDKRRQPNEETSHFTTRAYDTPDLERSRQSDHNNGYNGRCPELDLRRIHCEASHLGEPVVL